MKIIEVRELSLSGLRLIRYGRFVDDRGYFTETFRRSDFDSLDFMKGLEFFQCNESHSRSGVVRGLHLQWNPFMGKLIRTVSGRMVDLVLDIRLGSPTHGKAIAIDLPAALDRDTGDWLWVPPGFAHGNFFLEPTTIEYFCTGEYSESCEAAVSPTAADIDWSLCDVALKLELDGLLEGSPIMTDKDREGFSVAEWSQQDAAALFTFANC